MVRPTLWTKAVFTYDANTNVVTQVVTERQVAENSSQAKLIADARKFGVHECLHRSKHLIVDINADEGRG